jgi:hypothetical protein
VKLLSWWAELAEISVHEDEEEFSFGLTKLWHILIKSDTIQITFDRVWWQLGWHKAA